MSDVAMIEVEKKLYEEVKAQYEHDSDRVDDLGEQDEEPVEDEGPRCQICGGQDATETTKALNGLPKGVLACEDCRKAVKRREVGVRRNDDGSLDITDARKPPAEVEAEQASA